MDQDRQARWQNIKEYGPWLGIGVGILVLVVLIVLIRPGPLIVVFLASSYTLATYLYERLGWRLLFKYVALTVGAVFVVATVVLVVLNGYALQWTGFGQAKVAQDTQPAKTLWDWLDLLIIPLVLAIGGYLFSRSESQATQAAAERRAQDETLQAYLDHMSAILIPNKDQPSLYDEDPPVSLRSVARARTLTVLPRLDRDRKARVVQFLYESGLIAKDRPVVALSRADLNGVNLYDANLASADLSRADLSEADLGQANLRDANLTETNLRDAYLWSAKLHSTNLTLADLNGAELGAADLNGAKLNMADLSNASLKGANVTKVQLRSTGSLQGATMPDGQKQKYEVWRTSRGRGEDGQNSAS